MLIENCFNISSKPVDNFTDHLPLIDAYIYEHISGVTVTVCVFYAILFCFGVPGNLWVASVIIYILKSFRGLSQNQNMFLYILCLSIVDALVLLNLPMLISDILYVRWVFGSSLCKIYWIIESINKIISKFILTAMSFDRFLAVCRPNYHNYVKSIKGTLMILFLIFLLVIASLYPVYIYAEEINFEEILDVDNETVISHRSKCVLQMDERMLFSFTTYMFIIGFCLPSMLISYFYIRILCQVNSHRSSTVTTHISFKRVIGATFSLIIIYFVCWMPFWITVLYSTVEPYDDPSSTAIYVMYVVHLLVYVNSAINWILYAFLNKNLKETRVLAVKRNASARTRLLETIDGRPPRNRFVGTFDSPVISTTNQWL